MPGEESSDSTVLRLVASKVRCGVSKDQIARLLAEKSEIPEAAAADQLDRAVHKILKRLRQGRAATLPGLGKFKPGPPVKFEFRKEPPGKGGRRGRK